MRQALDSLEKRFAALRETSAPDKWPQIRTAIIPALDGYPEAREVLVTRLCEDRHQAKGWPKLRVFILDALQDFPAARESVIAALEEVGA